MKSLIQILEESGYLDENKITGFDPQEFLTNWFFSKKPKDPKIYKELAKHYPYKGRAFRLDDWEKPYNKPYASWSKSTNGLIQWKWTMNSSGQDPKGMKSYMGTITKGVDLTNFLKGEKIDKNSAAQDIIKVEEVLPITTVRDMKEVY